MGAGIMESVMGTSRSTDRYQELRDVINQQFANYERIRNSPKCKFKEVYIKRYGVYTIIRDEIFRLQDTVDKETRNLINSLADSALPLASVYDWVAKHKSEEVNDDDDLRKIIDDNIVQIVNDIHEDEKGTGLSSTAREALEAFLNADKLSKESR